MLVAAPLFDFPGLSCPYDGSLASIGVNVAAILDHLRSEEIRNVCIPLLGRDKATSPSQLECLLTHLFLVAHGFFHRKAAPPGCESEPAFLAILVSGSDIVTAMQVWDGAVVQRVFQQDAERTPGGTAERRVISSGSQDA